MKIAVVAPSPIPFTIGGVENLVWGLVEHINQNTSHMAELIKLPLREYSFWDLIESYYEFYKLDLTHFDIVISTKYPSWMVRQKKGICYMTHTLRGLYDKYTCFNKPEAVKRGVSRIDKILDWMEEDIERSNLDELFSFIFELKENLDHIPKSYFEFPAPFIRRIIHYLDNWALCRESFDRHFAISKTVAGRRDYFPESSKVKAVYPPPIQGESQSERYEHIFMISRLDSPKRIDMLIRAMRYVKADIPLYIAGIGPQEDELKALVQGDRRIHFLGRITDTDVDDYYKKSLVIPYFPLDEDYGLITIEAMLHHKPVITTYDAGGPTEFVKDGETGFTVEFQEKAIAEKIDYYANNPSEAKRMGDKAFSEVKDITWKNLVQELLGDEDKAQASVKANSGISIIKDSNRKKITVTSTFSVYPPLGGGQARIYNLYKYVAKEYDVNLISFIDSNLTYAVEEIAPHLYEHRIPKSQKHQEEELKIEKKVGIPITDIGMISLYKLTPLYLEKLEDSITNSNCIVISHPYLFWAAEPFMSNKPFIYESHNIESYIKREMLPKTKTSEELVSLVSQIEKECCVKSRFITVCSEDDKESLHSIYGIPTDKIYTIPNGVEISETKYVDLDNRKEKKRELGLSGEKLALFIGSWHGPNLEAAEFIIKIAPECPNTHFLLMGSQCEFFRGKKLPKNVGLLGTAYGKQKQDILSAVDLALNPMISGSGTNLKMFDYMAAGIPVITTPFGARGISYTDCLTISELDSFSAAINNFNLDDFSTTYKARVYVETEFDWEGIAKKYINEINKLFE